MRNLILFTLILLSTSPLIAQNMSVGIEAGIISSNTNNQIFSDFEHRRNTHYSGINFNYRLNQRVSFSTGLHYVRQGNTRSTCYFFEEGVKNQLVRQIDYLSIPLTADIHFLKSRKLIVTLGLLGSSNIKAAQVHPKPIGGCKIYFIPDITNVTEKYAMSGIAGIGYKVLSKNKFEVITSAKVYQGFTDTYKPLYQGAGAVWLQKKYNSALFTVKLNYKL